MKSLQRRRRAWKTCCVLLEPTEVDDVNALLEVVLVDSAGIYCSRLCAFPLLELNAVVDVHTRNRSPKHAHNALKIRLAPGSRACCSCWSLA